MASVKGEVQRHTVDPREVPQKVLYTGVKMPGVGMGTFGNDRFSGEEVAAAVRGGIEYGYRLFDCASAYGNEAQIGKAFREAMDKGVKREELFVISKLWNDMHGKGDVLIACAKTLKDLQLDYLDMYLVHWPFANTHPRGAAPDYRDPGARPYIHERYMETWRQMERLVKMGLVRHIGVSNMTIPKLELLLRDASIPPAANEVELHPTFQQPELFRYCTAKGMPLIGYSPIGSPTRPERDRDNEDVADIEDPVVNRIALTHNVHPAVVCIKWAAQRGHIPVPSTVYASEYESNLRCVTEDPLTEAEMEELAGVDKNCRLIKGKVFLWEGARDWRDLWDPDGEIPGQRKGDQHAQDSIC